MDEQQATESRYEQPTRCGSGTMVTGGIGGVTGGTGEVGLEGGVEGWWWIGGMMGRIGNQNPPVFSTIETNAGTMGGTVGVSSPGGTGSSGANTGSFGNA